jgi:hypothetical protein
MPGRIFISYRRDDDPAAAARVRDGLAHRFGKSNLFMDVDDLLAGLKFDHELAKALASCDVFIAIIGARWTDLLQSRSKSGDRDFVQEEIAGAIARGLVVIPVRVGRDGQLPRLPRAEELPAAIADLIRYQKHDVTHEYFGRDVGALADAITAVRLKLGHPHAGSVFARRWGTVTAAVAAAMVSGYAGAYFAGLPVPWPSVSVPAPGQSVIASSSSGAAQAPTAVPVAAKVDDAPRAGAVANAAVQSPSALQPAPEPAPDYVLRKSAPAGGKGGGEAFDEQYANLQHAPITGLNISVTRSVADRSQLLIGRLQVRWGDVIGPLHGGGPADVPTIPLKFEQGETIRRIVIFHKRFSWPDPGHAPVWISGLQVRTTKGAYTFGHADGIAVECTPANGEQIVGFFGRAGSYLDQLGCLFSKRAP